jgi:hypothetical protein
MKHLHDLVDIYHQVVDVDIDLNGFALYVESVAVLSNSNQLLMLACIHLNIVKIVLLCARVLLEKYTFWVRVSRFTKELSKDMAVLQAHPMRTFLVNSIIVGLKTSIFRVKLRHLLNISSGVGVPVISAILATNLNRKANVSHIIKLRVVRMSCHHGSASEIVSHHGPQMINSIASCRVSSDEYLIGVYESVKDKAADDDTEKVYEVGLPPHVWKILAGSRHEPDDSRRQLLIIEMEVIVKLLVVY